MNSSKQSTIKLEDMLAKRCLDNDKHPQLISEFDVNSIFTIKASGDCAYISPDKIEPGMHIVIACKMEDMETGLVRQGDLNVPCVKDFSYSNGNVLMESKSYMFSSVDFSKELKELKMEREQKQTIDFER